MAKIRRVDFSPDEWLSGTSELLVDEKGAYWTVCSLIYSRGEPIADDEAWISKACGCHWRQWRRIRERLLALGKISLTEDGRLTNGRAERELTKAANRVESAREAAERSARMRAERVARQAAEAAQEGRTTPAELPQERRTTAAQPAQDARTTSAEAPHAEPKSAKINGLASATASVHAQANHQPSTTNHQPSTTKEEEGLRALEPAGGGAVAPLLPLPDDGLDDAVTAYNESAERVGWPKALRMGQDRKTALRARLRECGGVAGWRALMQRAERSKFLRGETARSDDHQNWRADIDFFLKPKRLRKLMEGGYDDRDIPAQIGAGTGRIATLQRVHERFRLQRKETTA